MHVRRRTGTSGELQSLVFRVLLRSISLHVKMQRAESLVTGYTTTLWVQVIAGSASRTVILQLLVRFMLLAGSNRCSSVCK
jgi:hypothetical protein